MRIDNKMRKSQYNMYKNSKFVWCREITEKVFQILQSHWTAWFRQFFENFSAPLQLFEIFLGWLCVVILDIINLYFMTIFCVVPPWLSKVTSTEKYKCSSTILEFFLYDYFSPIIFINEPFPNQTSSLKNVFNIYLQ